MIVLEVALSLKAASRSHLVPTALTIVSIDDSSTGRVELQTGLTFVSLTPKIQLCTTLL